MLQTRIVCVNWMNEGSEECADLIHSNRNTLRQIQISFNYDEVIIIFSDNLILVIRFSGLHYYMDE